MTESQEKSLSVSAESQVSDTQPDTVTIAPSINEITEAVIDENATLLAKLSDDDLEYMNFVRQHRSRCEMWAKAHGNVDFPIIRIQGKLIWLTREQRRKIKPGK